MRQLKRSYEINDIEFMKRRKKNKRQRRRRRKKKMVFFKTTYQENESIQPT
jgi:hypothetical protein